MVSLLFRKQLLKNATPELRDALLAAAPGAATEDALFPLFAEYVLSEHGREIKRYRCAPPTRWILARQRGGARPPPGKGPALLCPSWQR